MPHHTGGHPFEQYRRDLENLNWSRGLMRDEIMSQCPNCPRDLCSDIPSTQRFTNFNEFWTYAETHAPMGRGGEGRMGGEGGTSYGGR